MSVPSLLFQIETMDALTAQKEMPIEVIILFHFHKVYSTECTNRDLSRRHQRVLGVKPRQNLQRQLVEPEIDQKTSCACIKDKGVQKDFVEFVCCVTTYCWHVSIFITVLGYQLFCIFHERKSEYYVMLNLSNKEICKI